MIKVTACVLARNEEKRIEIVLKTLKRFCDYIIVVDGDSGDNTVKIAEKYAYKVVLRGITENYAAEKNLAQDLAPSNWVLHVDVDEVWDVEFLKDMKWFIQTKDVLAFRFPRINPHFRDYPDYQIRLFDRDEVKWIRRVHETPISRQCSKPIDKISCHTLPSEFAIIHLPAPADFDKIRQQRYRDIVKKYGIIL